MAIIHVTRIPSPASMPKLIYILRGILKTVNVRDFWIKELADMREVDLKEARIEISTYENACRAVAKLNKYSMIEDNVCSVLTARLEEEPVVRSHSPCGNKPYYTTSKPYTRSRSPSYSRYSPKYSPVRDRSRSPLFRDTSKLDLEIELLRKQRLIIEEERKLLVERNKLEMIREYGVSASRELESKERSRDRQVRPKAEDRRRRESTPPLRPKKEFRRREPTPPPPSRRNFSSGVMPRFIKPCLHFMKEMNKTILTKIEPREKEPLENLIRTQIKRRLAVVLEKKKTFLPLQSIIELYRIKHPRDTDEAMITKCLEDLRMSHWLKPKRKRRMKTRSSDQAKKPNNEIQIQAKDEPDTSAIPVVNVKSEPVETIDLKKNTKVEPNIDGVNLANDAPEATMEQMTGPVDDWFEDGEDWNDTDDSEPPGPPVHRKGTRRAGRKRNGGQKRGTIRLPRTKQKSKYPQLQIVDAVENQAEYQQEQL